VCFLFSLLNTKTLTNNQNTKVYSLKHKTSFHICVTLKHFFKLKTKNTTKNTLTNKAIISFYTSTFILLLCPFLRLYIFSFSLLPTTFFSKKKYLHAHLFSCFVFLFISTHFLGSLDFYCKPHQVSTNIEVYHPWILGLTIMVYKGWKLNFVIKQNKKTTKKQNCYAPKTMT
jgi:hypothetical protein